jgi:hypothetical protein
MSIFDKLFAGNVIKDFGLLKEKSFGIGKIKQRALLVEQHGRYYLVLKVSSWFLLSASTHYEKFPLEDASKLRECIAESEAITKNLPPLEYDVSKTIRYSLIAAAIATVINLLTQDTALIFIATIIATVFQFSQYSEFKDHPNIDDKTRKWLFVIPIIMLLIAIPKFCWLSSPSFR